MFFLVGRQYLNQDSLHPLYVVGDVFLDEGQQEAIEMCSF